MLLVTMELSNVYQTFFSLSFNIQSLHSYRLTLGKNLFFFRNVRIIQFSMCQYSNCDFNYFMTNFVNRFGLFFFLYEKKTKLKSRK